MAHNWCPASTVAALPRVKEAASGIALLLLSPRNSTLDRAWQLQFWKFSDQELVLQKPDTVRTGSPVPCFMVPHAMSTLPSGQLGPSCLRGSFTASWNLKVWPHPCLLLQILSPPACLQPAQAQIHPHSHQGQSGDPPLIVSMIVPKTWQEGNKGMDQTPQSSHRKRERLYILLGFPPSVMCGVQTIASLGKTVKNEVLGK